MRPSLQDDDERDWDLSDDQFDDDDWNDNPTDEDAASVLGGAHPKSQRPPFSPGSGSAPGANGFPTTGPMGGQDSDF